jgi:hypothetical protein
MLMRGQEDRGPKEGGTMVDKDRDRPTESSPEQRMPDEKREFVEPALTRRGTLSVMAGEGNGYQIFSPGFSDEG